MTCCFSECQDALGVESGAISDAQMSASSQHSALFAVIHGRLHFKKYNGAWAPSPIDANPWLQIDLGNQVTKVTGVATQGRHSYNQWVTSFKLQYSDDGVNFHYYGDQPDYAPKVK